jgi:hypothetical protein
MVMVLGVLVLGTGRVEVQAEEEAHDTGPAAPMQIQAAA